MNKILYVTILLATFSLRAADSGTLPKNFGAIGGALMASPAGTSGLRSSSAPFNPSRIRVERDIWSQGLGDELARKLRDLEKRQEQSERVQGTVVRNQGCFNERLSALELKVQGFRKRLEVVENRVASAEGQGQRLQRIIVDCTARLRREVVNERKRLQKKVDDSVEQLRREIDRLVKHEEEFPPLVRR